MFPFGLPVPVVTYPKMVVIEQRGTLELLHILIRTDQKGAALSVLWPCTKPVWVVGLAILWTLFRMESRFTLNWPIFKWKVPLVMFHLPLWVYVYCCSNSSSLTQPPSSLHLCYIFKQYSELIQPFPCDRNCHGISCASPIPSFFSPFLVFVYP